MNTVFSILLEYFDSIEVEGSSIFQINIPNIIIFTIGLIYIIGSVFVIGSYKRQKKLCKYMQRVTQQNLNIKTSLHVQLIYLR
jgi:hypothetical protein